MRGDARCTAQVALGRALVRTASYLDVAEALLVEAGEAGPSYWVLDGLAGLAQLGKNNSRASSFRALAEAAPDAPTATERLQSEWASQAAKWRESDASPEGRRARLDIYFKARQARRRGR